MGDHFWRGGSAGMLEILTENCNTSVKGALSLFAYRAYLFLFMTAPCHLDHLDYLIF